MFELEKNETINKLITITKSDSGISGPELANSHIELGKALGKQIKIFDPSDTTIVAMLRGGIFFAEGVYFSIGCKFQVYDPKNEEFIRPETKDVILVDSVINTGKTILKIWTPDMYVASCVVNDKAVNLFADRLFTVRVSSNSYVGNATKTQVGNKGPDTTMRLFNLI